MTLYILLIKFKVPDLISILGIFATLLGIIITLIIGVWGLYFQNKAIKHNEKELSIKINDIQDVVKKLEKERDERISQINQKSNEINEQKRFVNSINSTLISSISSVSAISRKHLSIQNLSIIYYGKVLNDLITAIYDVNSSANPRQIIALEGIELIKKKCIIEAECYEIEKTTDIELEQAYNKYRIKVDDININTLTLNNYIIQIDEAVKQYEIDVALVIENQKKMVKSYQEKNQQVNSEFEKHIFQHFNGHSKI